MSGAIPLLPLYHFTAWVVQLRRISIILYQRYLLQWEIFAGVCVNFPVLFQPNAQLQPFLRTC